MDASLERGRYSSYRRLVRRVHPWRRRAGATGVSASPLRLAGRSIGAVGIALAIGVFSPACSDPVPDLSGVGGAVVRDSAGVEIVENDGAERPLDWRFEEVGRIHAAADSFGGLSAHLIHTNGVDRIYAWDRLAFTLHAFDDMGTHLWSSGRKGEGPGELQAVNWFSVQPRGDVYLADMRGGSLVHLDEGGELVEEIPARADSTSPFTRAVLNDGTRISWHDLRIGSDRRDYSTAQSVLATSATTGSVVALGAATLIHKEIPIDRCGSTLLHATIRPFDDYPVFAATADRVLLRLEWADYRVDYVDAAGRLRRSVRRATVDRPVDEALAIRQMEAPNSGPRKWSPTDETKGRYADCPYDQSARLAEVGYEPVIPAVRDLIPTPDGGAWVRRWEMALEDELFDVFDPEGRYVGTLPHGTEWPLGFLQGDRVVYLETDEFDRPSIVVRQIIEGG